MAIRDPNEKATPDTSEPRDGVKLSAADLIATGAPAASHLDEVTIDAPAPPLRPALDHWTETERRTVTDPHRRRRASDLSEEQQSAIARAIVTFSEFAGNESVITSRLLLLIDTCHAVMQGCDVTVTICSDSGSPQVLGATSPMAHAISSEQLADPASPLRQALASEVGLLTVDLAVAGSGASNGAHREMSTPYRTLFVVPLWIAHSVVGAISVYDRRANSLPDNRMEWIGALANSAALSFRTGRSEAQARELGDQLQRGLIGRTLVNDAKRLLAAEMKMGDDEALELLRHYSRSHSRSIVEVAADTVERRISLNELTEEPGHPEFRRS